MLSAAQHGEALATVVEVRPSWSVEDVYRRHGALVLRWAARLGGPGIDLEDVVHDVFVRVQRALSGFRGDAEVTTWLYQVTRNVVGHQRRKNQFRRWLGGSAKDVAGDLRAPGPGPVELLEQRQATERVCAVLDQLSEKDRAVLVLFELEQRSGEEVAQIMNARVETVWVWLHRARQRFSARAQQLEER
jgi:RNA polymerase sigma-70 factor (ECF subfamily)